MRHFKDISIVIVSYNVKDLLLQCIKSIKASEFVGNFEIIVVDNDSKDGTINEIKKIHQDVVLIENSTNLGFGKANNQGFEIVNSKYTLILNPDTILEANTLSTMYDYMESNSKCGISGCKLLNEDGSFQLACRRGFPTPWASFTKLFGLQSLFPRSPIFAKYNLTYLDINQTYKVDSIIGAFMFCRTELLKQLGGFDETFFMYGEDIDLCKRTLDFGYETHYLHTTSTIHLKGESTKRSSINQIKHFYEAMVIYASKHHGNSKIFLFFLKFGIWLRQLISIIVKNKTAVLAIFIDTLLINIALLVSSKILRDDYFWFPDYAYPLVFIVVGIVNILVMSSIGEYFEKHGLKNVFYGLMIDFFILSSLTYYFKDFAFSRGILLLTITISTLLFSISRILFSKLNKSDTLSPRVGLIVDNQTDISYITELQYKFKNFEVFGLISQNTLNNEHKFMILGNIEYINQIIVQYKLTDLIIVSDKVSYYSIINKLESKYMKSLKILMAHQPDQLETSSILINTFGQDAILPKHNFALPRFKAIKFLTEYLTIFLIFGFKLFQFFLPKVRNIKFDDLGQCLIRRKMLVGAIKENPDRPGLKKGVFNLSKFGLQKNDTIYQELDEYYYANYNPLIDFQIIFNNLMDNKNG